MEPTPTEERRRHRRLPYRSDVQVTILATEWTYTAKLEDLSMSGCYIETQTPPEQGTRIRVSFWMDEEEFAALGVIRYARPGLGMGIEFTQLEPDNHRRLTAFLERRKPGSPRPLVTDQGELPFEPSESDE